MENISQKVIIAGLSSPSLPEDERCTEESMDELAALAETAGGTVVARVVQNRPAPDAHTYIGEGKAKEIAELAKNLEADTVIFDNALSPSQLRGLEDACGCGILDRSGIILDIFAGRAKSAEGKLQVELAQYQYLLPRLVGYGKILSRLGGGIGTRGPGESKLESDRRHIRRRIDKLKEDLDSVRRVRAEQRRQREKSGVPRVALAGYTNAGKSSLLNYLTGAKAEANDRLFDTLDPATRRFDAAENMPVLITDTVGFIRRLPHHLIDAFRATLEELEHADLILHVIDGSNPNWRSQAEVAQRLITELMRPETPVLLVFNKMDKGLPEIPSSPDAVFVSALTGAGMDELKSRIAAALSGVNRQCVLQLPYNAGALLDLLYREAVVQSVKHESTGITVHAICSAKIYGQVRQFDVTNGAELA